MKKWGAPGLLLAIAILFLILNRGAYQSYFQDDELDNLTWAPHAPAFVWLSGIISPFFSKDNFRPAGHFYFFALGSTARIYFPAYVVVLQLLHLVNASLVWRLAQKLGLGLWCSCCAAAFFALSAAALDAYWEPAYVFDVLCCTFSLACLLLYMRRNVILSFVAFWLAYKSKELAVMLPAVLLSWEMLIGHREWRRLIPFFLVSVSFGLQGLLLNPNKNNEYTFRFTWTALAKTIPFYAQRFLQFPFSGLVLIAIGLAIRDRRAWFGAAIMILLSIPLLFLPGRLYEAYCYGPMVGASLILAASVSKIHPAWALAFFALFIPWNLKELRAERKTILARAEQVRPYLAAVLDYAKKQPQAPAIVFANKPEGFAYWGVAACSNLAWNRTDLQPVWIDAPESARALKNPRVAYMVWDPPARRLNILERAPDIADRSYLTMNILTPPWQLTSGFEPLDGHYRWIQPDAGARLWEQPGLGQFEVIVNIPPILLEQLRATTLQVTLDGMEIGRSAFSASGRKRIQFPVPLSPLPHETNVGFHVEPMFHPDPSRMDRVLGIALESFGFVAPSSH